MSRRTLATLYGAGLSPVAPGTVGSLVAAVLAWGILMLPFGWWLLGIGTLVYTLLGIRSTDRYMQAHGTAHDPKEVVVDELAGQWLTYLLAPLLGVYMLHDNVFMLLEDPALLQRHIVLGFILFRTFDIIKPWPIILADRHVEGGFGVMLDDLLAGVFAAFVLCYLDISMQGASSEPISN